MTLRSRFPPLTRTVDSVDSGGATGTHIWPKPGQIWGTRYFPLLAVSTFPVGREPAELLLRVLAAPPLRRLSPALLAAGS
jgi:hypothetical protein